MIKINNLLLSLNRSSSSSISSNNLDLMLRRTTNSILLNSNNNNSSCNNRNLLNKQQHSKNLAITTITNSKRRVHQFQDHKKRSSISNSQIQHLMLPLCNRNTVKPNKKNLLRKNLILRRNSIKMEMKIMTMNMTMRRLTVMKKKINSMPMITLKISRELNNQNHKKVAKNMKIDYLQ